MKRLALILFVGIAAALPVSMLVSMLGAEPVRAEKPMFKGVELYSWKDDAGIWRYSLLPGTNREKTKDEIVSESTVIKDIDALKKRLAALAVGENVFWFNADAPGFAFPNSGIVADIIAYAKQIQITVWVPQ
jgi:hypothetical protein